MDEGDGPCRTPWFAADSERNHRRMRRGMQLREGVERSESTHRGEVEAEVPGELEDDASLVRGSLDTANNDPF